jgi:hypothetical protein
MPDSKTKRIKFPYLGHQHVVILSKTDFMERELAMITRAKQALGTSFGEAKLVDMTGEGPPRITSLDQAGA